jgi:tetratricopeptide (TPR) repeat protein
MSLSEKRSDIRASHVRARRLAARACALLYTLPALGLLPRPGACAETNWLDLESRIQYGYFTEDARSVRSVIDGLAPLDPADPSRNYYAGLASYRLTQLTAAADKSHAKQAAEQCVSSLDRALESRKDFADALALQSACLDQLASLEPWRAPFAASRSGTQLEKARHAEPGNPRVLFLNAVGDYERPASGSADKERALVEFRKAADAFEAERRDVDHVPGWGAAEAYVYLARCYLDRGSTLQARDALERALLIAPEYAQARKLMARITSG